MPYDYLKELERVRKYYSGDSLQKRFSALVTGESGSGKTFLLSTARKPIHIDSFDPGGSKSLRSWIKRGDVVVDTSWEREDPFDPKVFGEWMKTVDIRLQIGYFDHFGTYALDSATTWGDAVMNYQLAGDNRAGQAPKFTRDYTPQKMLMINYIKKLMNIPSDFFLLGHLSELREAIGQSSTGETSYTTRYRFLTTGKAVITIPLQFDELYVLKGTPQASGIKRELLVEAQGKYLARSRLAEKGLLSSVEEPNIKGLLKKVGLSWEDKPPLPEGGEQQKEEK